MSDDPMRDAQNAAVSRDAARKAYEEREVIWARALIRYANAEAHEEARHAFGMTLPTFEHNLRRARRVLGLTSERLAERRVEVRGAWVREAREALAAGCSRSEVAEASGITLQPLAKALRDPRMGSDDVTVGGDGRGREEALERVRRARKVVLTLTTARGGEEV